MANGASPYQVAAPTVNLMGQAGVTKKKKETGDLETALQMGRMEEAFRQETEGLGTAAHSGGSTRATYCYFIVTYTEPAVTDNSIFFGCNF